MNIFNNYSEVISSSLDNINILSTKKNIIYCITNTVNNKKYIGKTINTFNYRYNNSWVKNTKNKSLKEDILIYGENSFCVEILEYGWSADDLLRLESYYIATFNTLYPNGYNMQYDDDPMNDTDDGFIYIAGYKNKIINKFQKDKNDKCIKKYLNYGRKTHHSQETRMKISQKIKGQKRSPETKQKITEALLKRDKSFLNKYKKSVLQIDIKTNEIVKEFDSISEASRFFNKKDNSLIGAVCRGKGKIAYGFKWRFKN